MTVFRASAGLAALAAGLLVGQAAALGRCRPRQDFVHAEIRLLPVPRHRRARLAGHRAQVAPDPLPFEALSAFVRTSSREMPCSGKLSEGNEDPRHLRLSAIDRRTRYKSIPQLNN
jgi:hypothetical protein